MEEISAASRIPLALASSPALICVPPAAQFAPAASAFIDTRLARPPLPAVPVTPAAPLVPALPLHTYCTLLISAASSTPLVLASSPALILMPPAAQWLPAVSAVAEVSVV